jgi:hypothetical protein
MVNEKLVNDELRTTLEECGRNLYFYRAHYISIFLQEMRLITNTILISWPTFGPGTSCKRRSVNHYKATMDMIGWLGDLGFIHCKWR